MATFMKSVSNSIWHAFNSLSGDKNGTVSKSKLKVLTANIGTLLELYGVEKGIEHYRSTQNLNFEHYKYYLLKEVFSSLPDALSLPVSRQYEASIDEVCWLVCKKGYLQREQPVFSDDSVYQLFRTFCLLGETTEGDPPQVVMHSSEMGRVSSLFVSSLGREWEGRGFEELAAALKSEFRFPVFLAVLEGRYAAGVEAAALKEAVNEIYDIFVEDVIKKGTLLRRGYLLPTLREYWFVLRPTELAYYKNPNDDHPSGVIPLDSNCWTDPSPGQAKDRVHRFILVTGERSFELAVNDHKTRLQWITALQQAISLSHCDQSHQRSQAVQRRKQRELENATHNEEVKRRKSQVLDMELARAQLEAEKTARLAAEMQARELEVQARLEASRRRELEATRRRLEELLEEETRAKRDEEIVRSLQARVLREEWERREELEKMQVEQLQLLEVETEKRKVFEKMQKEREVELEEAENRLKTLEEERRRLDQELSAARRNMLLSECSKQALETQLRAVSPHPDRLPRRAASFMPSTKERPVHLVNSNNVSAGGTLPRSTRGGSVCVPLTGHPKNEKKQDTDTNANTAASENNNAMNA